MHGVISALGHNGNSTSQRKLKGKILKKLERKLYVNGGSTSLDSGSLGYHNVGDRVPGQFIPLS